jgi:hypothetical protein
MINSIENIQNRKDLKNPLVFKTHLPFTLLPKQISSGEKKPKVNLKKFFASKLLFFPLDNLRSTRCQRHVRLLLSLR